MEDKEIQTSFNYMLFEKLVENYVKLHKEFNILKVDLKIKKKKFKKIKYKT